MSTGTHDTIVYRLSEILIQLNRGDKLNPSSLADMFGVNRRTIQRDMNERFAHLPIEKTNGLYHLNPAFLGKITLNDVEGFAKFAGVDKLFPDVSSAIISGMIKNGEHSSLMVKGHDYESIEGKEVSFNEIRGAIDEHYLISFSYKKTKVKRYDGIKPYKLVNNKGVWYLLGDHGNRLKTFSFNLIENLVVSGATFIVDKDILNDIEEDDGVWVSKEIIEVLVDISSDVSHYFLRRKLLPNQVLIEQKENGELIVLSKVSHINQILPIIRYWLPYVQIKEPEYLKDALNKSLQAYLDSC